MKRRKNGQRRLRRSLSNGQRSGFALIFAVIVMSALLSVVAIATVLVAITALDASQISRQGGDTSVLAHDCLEEGLLQLRRDNDYTGSTLNRTSGQCTVAVSGVGGTRTITSIAQYGIHTITLSAAVTLAPFAVTDFDN